MALRAHIQGSKFYDPDGNEFIPFGTNSRAELTQPRDGRYLRDCLHVNTVRIEFHWWENGTGGEARLDGAPGHIDPVYWQSFLKQVGYYRNFGLWIAPAIHSKCGHDGRDDGAGLGAYCGSVGPYATPGRNFWSDPTQEVIHDEMLYWFAQQLSTIDGILHIEPINEPNPTGFTDADVNAYYTRRLKTLQAANADDLYLLGANGGYLVGKIDTAFQPGFPNKCAYTGDMFNNQGSGADTAARLVQWMTRFQNALNMRDARNVPIIIQQFGATLGDDPDRSNLAGQLLRLYQNRTGGYQWENRAPGPGGGTFGWLQLQADVNAPDIVRTADELLMQQYGQLFARLTAPAPAVQPLSFPDLLPRIHP